MTDELKQGISLCMIVKNEESFLKDCLDSVKGVVNEIIIVDTGSEDSTVQIAEEAGAKVYNTVWKDDFSKARNLGISKANFSWILVLDADEKISASDIEELGKLITRKGVYGFRLNQRTYVENSNLTNAVSCKGEYSEEKNYPAYLPQDVVRLFRNYSRIEYRDRVHEIVEHSMHENHLEIEDSQIPIHHYGKVIAPEKLQTKMNLYIELGKQKVNDNMKDIRSALELLDQLLEAGKPDEALKLSTKFLTKFPNDPRVQFSAGLAAEAMSMNEEAAKYYKEILKSDETHLGALNNYSSLLQKSGNAEASIILKEKAEKYYPNNAVLKYNLANGYFEAGNYIKAEETYKSASALEPNNLMFLYRLAEYYFFSKSFSNAREYFKKVLKINPRQREAQLGLRDSHIQLTTIPMNDDTVSFFQTKSDSR